jgi:hypothetical protein
MGAMATGGVQKGRSQGRREVRTLWTRGTDLCIPNDRSSPVDGFVQVYILMIMAFMLGNAGKLTTSDPCGALLPHFSKFHEIAVEVR